MSLLTQPIVCLRSCKGSDITHPSGVHSGKDTGKPPVLVRSGQVREGGVFRTGAGGAEIGAPEPEQEMFLKEMAHELSLKGWLDFARLKRKDIPGREDSTCEDTQV